MIPHQRIGVIGIRRSESLLYPNQHVQKWSPLLTRLSSYPFVGFGPYMAQNVAVARTS